MTTDGNVSGNEQRQKAALLASSAIAHGIHISLTSKGTYMFDELEDPQEELPITLEEAEQDAADTASVIAEFYHGLTKSGVPEKYAFRLTRDYMICTFGGEIYL